MHLTTSLPNEKENFRQEPPLFLYILKCSLKDQEACHSFLSERNHYLYCNETPGKHYGQPCFWYNLFQAVCLYGLYRILLFYIYVFILAITIGYWIVCGHITVDFQAWPIMEPIG